MILLGFLIVFGIFTLSILLGGGSLQAFWDLRAFGILFVGITFHIAWFGREFFLPGLKTIFRTPRPERGETDPKLGEYFRRLTGFTLGFAAVVASVGLLMVLADMNPDNVGQSLATSLLIFVYAIGIALTIFLPISLRHLPDSTGVNIFPVGLTLAGFASFFITRALMIALLVAIMDTAGLLEDIKIIVKQTFFSLNPADLHGSLYDYCDLRCFWNTSGVVAFLGCLGGFRLASGRIHNRWTWTPVCILYGIWGTIMGMVIMLGEMDPVIYPIGCCVALLTTFYGILAAIFFAIRGQRRTSVPDSTEPQSLPMTPEEEQAKQILDKAVKGNEK